jgi:glutamine amidotransferase
MCRLFGMTAGEQRARATFWLLGAPDSLRAQSHREPDGTGLGWFDEDGAPQVRKQARAAYEDRAFAHEAREVSSSTFIAHVRFATTGTLERRNTHPFEQHGRLFAHNGVIQDLPGLEAQLGDDRVLVHGETDSERLFALITREIAAHGGDVEAGIATACRWVAANLPLLSINLILITQNDLWALRYPDTHELHLLQRAPGMALEHESSYGSRVHSDQGAGSRFVVVATEPMDDDPGWRAIDPGDLVRVGSDLTVTSHTILPDPPAHPLTIADLGSSAGASQADGPLPG